MRRLSSLLLSLVVAVPLVGVVSDAPAVHAEGELRIESTTTYTVDPATGDVRVRADLAITNQVPNKTSGNIISKAYYTGFSLPAPAAIVNGAVVSSNGSPLSFEIVPAGSPDFILFDIDFAKNIFYQQTARISVSYDLVGGEPRTDSPFRINPSYASFEAFGIGDPGLTTVQVVIPATYEVETFGSDAERQLRNGLVTYTASNIENPDEFFLAVSARNDLALESDRVTIDGNDYAINHWPGDDEWAEFVETQIDDGLPVLENLIGEPWPIAQRFELRQANTPYLYGYAGWFSAIGSEIEVGEELDQEVILHELSHAWFNSDRFDERWLSEGFAQEYSNLAIEELGGTRQRPTIPRDSDAHGFQLNQWTNLRLDDNSEAQEEYGYNTSWYVVRELVDEVGVDTMQSVLDAFDSEALAYPGRIDASLDVTMPGWQRLLDWCEQLGEAPTLQQLLTDWVLTDADAALLPGRNDAREAYAALEAAGDTWTPPVAVRRAMSEWEFKRSAALVESAMSTLEVRDELREISKRLGVTIPGVFQERYERSDDDVDALARVRETITDQLDAAQAVEAAEVAAEAPRDFTTRIGLIGTDVVTPLAQARGALSAGDPDAARAAAATETELLADAAEIGKQRVLRTVAGVDGFLVLVVGLLLVRRRRRRRHARRAATVAATEAAALAEGDPVEK